MPVEKLPPLDEWFEYCDKNTFQDSASDLKLMTDFADSIICLKLSFADNIILSPQIKSFFKDIESKILASTELMRKSRPRKNKDNNYGFCNRVIPASGEAECRYEMWLYSTNIYQP